MVKFTIQRWNKATMNIRLRPRCCPLVCQFENTPNFHNLANHVANRIISSAMLFARIYAINIIMLYTTNWGWTRFVFF